MSDQRFIPLRKSTIIEQCSSLYNESLLNDKEGGLTNRALFFRVNKLIESLFHHQFHEQLERLKSAYAPFDLMSDTVTIEKYTQQDLLLLQSQLAIGFERILQAANYEKITPEDLEDALQQTSLFKVKLHVQFEDFDEVVFYRRGEQEKTETLVKWFGLKKLPITFTNFEKVAVYIKFKDKDYFDSQKRDLSHITPGSTIIKLFQNVPKADLEMLFPNSEVRMRTIDKAIIGGSAVIGGTIMLVTKLGGSLILLAALFSYWLGFSDKEVTIGKTELIGLAVAFGVLGGFIFKEWGKFKNRKMKFMKSLTENLYFKNLDNNAGVFHHVIDAAEEEECKEAILAYHFLLQAKEGLTVEELDQAIETWLSTSFDVHINFEIDDALNKLQQLGIVEQKGNRFTALPLREANALLVSRWDDIFN